MMCRTTSTLSIIALSFLCCATGLFALDGAITIPVSADGILHSENLQLISGRQNQPELVLADMEYPIEQSTDLLLHFNQASDLSDGGHYQIGQTNWTIQNQQLRFGKGAARFNKGPASYLETRSTAIFHPGNFPGSFSMEFWLYTSDYGDGQNIFRWEGSAWLDKKLMPQLFQVGIHNRKIIWTFDRFFLDLDTNGPSNTVKSLSFTLQNRRELLPKAWTHHLLRYDAKRGLLEYLVNGNSEDLIYTTESKQESGQVYQPYVGERSNPRISLGTGLSAFIDEFRISRQWVQQYKLNGRTDAGYAIFAPISFRDIGAGSKILKMNSRYSEPGQSAVRFYYMMVDALPRVLERSNPNWRLFQPNAPITENNSGLWLCLKVELLPDGSGESRPGVQAITVNYTPDPPPPAPGSIQVIPGDGQLTIRWNQVPTQDIQGYMIYFGPKSGQYFGSERTGIKSPIILAKENLTLVGNTYSHTIYGLENYLLYYITVASYDRSNSPGIGEDLRRSLSKEVSARPAP